MLGNLLLPESYSKDKQFELIIENKIIVINISLQFVTKGAFSNMPALV